MPRTVAPPEAVHALAQQALSEWGLDDAELTLFVQSENAVFRVKTKTDEIYALRVHREGYHDLAELESEHVWTLALARAGILVPEAVPALDGRAYATVDFPIPIPMPMPMPMPTPTPTQIEYPPRHVGLVRWITGVPLQQIIKATKDPAEMSGCFEKLGGLIATFHDCTSKWTAPPDFRRHAWDRDGLVGEQPFWGRFWEISDATDEERSRLVGLREALSERLLGLDRSPEFYGMIHADLHSNNVLVDGDQLTVIDFDDAGFGWYIHDLAVALYGELKNPHFELARDALLEGYRAIRPLSGEQLELLSWFILARALMILRWAEDRPEVGYDKMLATLKGTAFDRAKQLGLG